jgi:hypothetical protein
MSTIRYYLRGARGYIAQPTATPSWTAQTESAYHWSTSEAAHRARKAYGALSAAYDNLVVVVRDGTTTPRIAV